MDWIWAVLFYSVKGLSLMKMLALRVAFACPDEEHISHDAPALTRPQCSPPGRPEIQNKKKENWQTVLVSHSPPASLPPLTWIFNGLKTHPVLSFTPLPSSYWNIFPSFSFYFNFLPLKAVCSCWEPPGVSQSIKKYILFTYIFTGRKPPKICVNCNLSVFATSGAVKLGSLDLVY